MLAVIRRCRWWLVWLSKSANHLLFSLILCSSQTTVQKSQFQVGSISLRRWHTVKWNWLGKAPDRAARQPTKNLHWCCTVCIIIIPVHNRIKCWVKRNLYHSYVTHTNMRLLPTVRLDNHKDWKQRITASLVLLKRKIYLPASVMLTCCYILFV